jgi:hypothetical protein
MHPEIIAPVVWFFRLRLASVRMQDTVCDICGKELNTYSGMKRHKGLSHKLRYHDKEWLREQIQVKCRSVSDIAEMCDTNSKTVWRWVDKHDVEVFWKGGRKKTAGFLTDAKGYERWQCTVNTESVKVHRLLAVAKFGIDEVKNEVVHHENAIRWDNRPDNIEVMDTSEHSELHRSQQTFERYENGQYKDTV